MSYIYSFLYVLAALPVIRKGVHMLRLPPGERSVSAGIGVLFVTALALAYLIAMTFMDLLF